MSAYCIVRHSLCSGTALVEDKLYVCEFCLRYMKKVRGGIIETLI